MGGLREAARVPPAGRSPGWKRSTPWSQGDVRRSDRALLARGLAVARASTGVVEASAWGGRAGRGHEERGVVALRPWRLDLASTTVDYRRRMRGAGSLGPLRPSAGRIVVAAEKGLTPQSQRIDRRHPTLDCRHPEVGVPSRPPYESVFPACLRVFAARECHRLYWLSTSPASDGSVTISNDRGWFRTSHGCHP
jgi:hypothetical protein